MKIRRLGKSVDQIYTRIENVSKVPIRYTPITNQVITENAKLFLNCV